MEFTLSQIEHNYPKQVYILNNGFLNTLLTQISQSQTIQPLFNTLLTKVYNDLFTQILNNEWPTVATSVPTRMTEVHTDQKLNVTVFDEKQKAVCVDIARAGMVPSQVIFDLVNYISKPEGIRQDHIFASRMTNQNNAVTHTCLQSSKIGGDVDDALVFLPDPMGATGSSLCEVISHYKNNIKGTAKRYISVHLIVTPEFIKKVTATHPDAQIYAARVDRGFSNTDALEQIPGKLWDQEKGLNENQYIVPGAGGVGELINNSFV